MDSEIIMKNGEPIGTQGPTGHYVLLDAHFELPSGKYDVRITSPLAVNIYLVHRWNAAEFIEKVPENFM